MKEESRFNLKPRYAVLLERVSWPAIFAGAVLAIVIQLMLGSLGVGIGASTVDPLTEQQPMRGLGIGSAIWMGITVIIAMFIGGWIASRFSGVPLRSSGIVHGAVAWAAATLFMVYLLASAATGLMSGAATLGSIATSPQISSELRQALERRGIDIDELSEQVQGVPGEQRAQQAGSAIATGVTAAGIGGFVWMTLGLAGAILGGMLGVPREHEALTIPTERAA